MNPPSEDVKTILANAAALSLVYGLDLFVSEMPDSPDACVCVYDTGGFAPEAGYTYERPTVQVRVRGDVGQYKTAHELAQSIRNELNGYANHLVGSSTRYVGIWAMGDVLHIGYDDAQRPLLSVNFRIHRTST